METPTPVYVHPDICTGEQECVQACPYWAIDMVEGKAVINALCTECLACLPVCPTNAITYSGVVETETSGVGRAIWAVVETRDDQLTRLSREMLSKARQLANEMEARLVGIVMVHYDEENRPAVRVPGVDEILVVAHSSFHAFHVSASTEALAQAALSKSPEVILFPGSEHYEELAARLANRLDCGMASTCNDIVYNPVAQQVEGIRLTYNGNVLTRVGFSEKRPNLLTLAPGAARPIRLDGGGGVAVTAILPTIEPTSVDREKVQGFSPRQGGTPMHRAKRIVSIGPGVATKEEFDQVSVLAKALDATLAGTRMIRERGWVDDDHTIIGALGTIGPDLYVSVGHTGTDEHLAVIAEARYVVALTRDPNANILQQSNLGIIGDPVALALALAKEIAAARGVEL